MSSHTLSRHSYNHIEFITNRYAESQSKVFLIDIINFINALTINSVAKYFQLLILIIQLLIQLLILF